MEGTHRKYRLGWISIIAMLSVGLISDIATIIPFVGDVVGPLFWIFMSGFLYFKKHGLMSWRTFLPSITSLVIEVIPVLQEIPTFTLAVAIIATLSRLEDSLGINVSGVASVMKGNISGLRKAPLNQGGVRRPG